MKKHDKDPAEIIKAKIELEDIRERIRMHIIERLENSSYCDNLGGKCKYMESGKCMAAVCKRSYKI